MNGDDEPEDPRQRSAATRDEHREHYRRRREIETYARQVLTPPPRDEWDDRRKVLHEGVEFELAYCHCCGWTHADKENLDRNTPDILERLRGLTSVAYLPYDRLCSRCASWVKELEVGGRTVEELVLRVPRLDPDRIH